MNDTKISWAQQTWNPAHGCHKVDEGRRHCLHPDTLVLHADLLWRPLRHVKAGDVLVGIEEDARGKGSPRTFQRSIVQAVWSSRKPAVKVTTRHTSFIASPDQPFLSARTSKWITVRRFSLATERCFLANGVPEGPPVEDEDYMRGYIAGITDGDGTFRYEPGQRSDKLGYPQAYWRVALVDPEPLHRLQRYLRAFGVQVELRPFMRNNGRGYRKEMNKVETRALSQLAVLHDILHRYSESASFSSGYLAGIFDAEGSYSRYSLRICNTDDELLKRVRLHGASQGVDFQIERYNGNRTMTARAVGAGTALTFFSKTNPAIQRKREAFFKKAAETVSDPEVGFEFLGKRT